MDALFFIFALFVFIIFISGVFFSKNKELKKRNRHLKETLEDYADYIRKHSRDKRILEKVNTFDEYEYESNLKTGLKEFFKGFFFFQEKDEG